ncbi:foxn3: Forkhead box protein N3 [Crotalus adamanteus]|uniref:Foxn3: Forkhead box protein N3 n=1 Tax=Crotalus adamanteus TaxID=8729 RepID=A0AAW1C535_CROAD
MSKKKYSHCSQKCEKYIILKLYFFYHPLQSIGKGSLWCIDPEYRQNLIQALKKTPYHPYSHVFSTPPASPQAYQR